MYSNALANTQVTTATFVFQSTINLFISPCFLIYGLLSIAKKHLIAKKWWWLGIHLLAFITFLVVDIGILNDYSLKEIQQIYKNPPLPYLLFYKLHHVLQLVALWWFLGQIKKYRQQIKANYSFIEPIRLMWLQNITWVFLTVHVLSSITFLLYNFGVFGQKIEIAFLVLNMALMLAMFFMSYKGIRHYTTAELYQWQQEKALEPVKPATENQQAEEKPRTEVLAQATETTSTEEEKIPAKYQSSSLSETEMQRIHQQMLRLFDEDQLYLEPKLQLQEVATALDVTSHVLSQTINTITQQTFYHLVNGYRVEHLKKLLGDPAQKQYTILALGFDSGFNSKASLNRIFKQYTGQTPREYQKTQ